MICREALGLCLILFLFLCCLVSPTLAGPVQVAHPPSRYTKGRPDWMRLGGYCQELELDPEWTRQTESVLFEAFPAQEGLDSLATDRVIAYPEKPLPPLLLPPGEYLIRCQRADGSSRTLGFRRVLEK